LKRLLDNKIATLEGKSKQYGEPDFVTRFKREGLWKIEDTRNEINVLLSRQYGNEMIRVFFSINDADDDDDDDDEEEEDKDENNAGKNYGNEDQDPDWDEGLFTECQISIQKSNKGALLVDALVSENSFDVERIFHSMNANLAKDRNADTEWHRDNIYSGPMFDDLDDDVQAGFNKYLKERGINNELATFITKYSEHKEQKI